MKRYVLFTQNFSLLQGNAVRCKQSEKEPHAGRQQAVRCDINTIHLICHVSDSLEVNKFYRSFEPYKVEHIYILCVYPRH
jgi:hypothetical protein